MIESLKRLWIRLTCFDACPFIFHHGPLREVQRFDRWVQKLRCERCGKYFGINHQVEAVLPWDDEFERFYCMLYQLSRTNR
jgi:hypothetical protein